MTNDDFPSCLIAKRYLANSTKAKCQHENYTVVNHNVTNCSIGKCFLTNFTVRISCLKNSKIRNRYLLNCNTASSDIAKCVITQCCLERYSFEVNIKIGNYEFANFRILKQSHWFEVSPTDMSKILTSLSLKEASGISCELMAINDVNSLVT